MHINAAGDRALLVTLPGATSARLRVAAERARGIAGVVAAIVGHESVYVIGTTDAAALRRAVEEAGSGATSPITRHHIDVSFHADYALDLTDFLAHVHLSREDFLERLRDIRLSVRYLGFRAGFSYLDGWPQEWSKPRRVTSRNHVPGGSFGIAGSMAGFYAVDSPGGWNILGRTAAPLWDPLREPPNLLAPGDEIEIGVIPRRVDGEGSPAQERGGSLAPLGMTRSLAPLGMTLAPGQLTTIVGPPDWSRVEYGLPACGPFDEEAAATANAAVGNDPRAPLLECVLVGPKLRLNRRAAFCDGDLNVRVFQEGELDIGRIHGMRGYLAIEGGVDEMRLRYAELPTVLKKGDGLWSAVPWHRFSSTAAKAAASRRTPKTIRIIPGPHDAPPLPEEWEVTPQLNRVGIRLRPLQPVRFTPPADLPSCGAQFGTLQWHADGTVVALGPDHPVTGGYLQPATIISVDLWKLAQLAPGDRIRLIAVEC